MSFDFSSSKPLCFFRGHMWDVQERGHKCRWCGMEEYIDPHFGKVVLDPAMPKGEIHFRDSNTGRLVGKITGIE